MALDLKNGESVIMDGAVYKLMHRALSGDLCFQDWETGNVRQISEQDLLKKYMAGQTTLWVPSALQPKNGARIKPDAALDWERKNLQLDIGSLTREQREQVDRWKAYVEAIMKEGTPARRAETWPALIDATARAISDPKGAPSWQTVSRWLRRYIASRCDIRSLISGDASKGRRRAERSDPAEQKLLSETLGLWLTEAQPTKQWVYNQVELAYANARATVIGATQWKMPCRATVYRMLDDIDLFERVRRREGKRAAAYLFNTVRPGRPPEFRLEVVEIDHTRADVWVMDDDTQYLLGRPWLTIAIDRYTRMIVGVYIGFESPSAHSVMQCIRNMILPKLDMLEKIQVQGPWNPYGVPVTVMVDNGQDFISDAVRNALAALGITIAQQPANRPEYKGIVERVMRTIKQSGLTWMPGKVRILPQKSRGYDPRKFACIGLNDFRKCFFQWLIFDYTNSTHSGIMDIPGKRWAQQVEQHPVFIPNHVNDLEAVLGLRVVGIIGRRGLRFRNLFYQSPELTRIRRDPRLSNKVQFTVDPGNLGLIRVTHPGSQSIFKVPAAIMKYADGLTLYQHDLIRTFILKANKSYENQAELLEGRRLLHEASLALLKDGKTKNRSRVTRGSGIGVTQPQSDMEKIVAQSDDDPTLEKIIAADKQEEAGPTDPDAVTVNGGAGQESAPGSARPAAKKARRPAKPKKLKKKPHRPVRQSELEEPPSFDQRSDDQVEKFEIDERLPGRRYGPHDSK